MSAKLDAKGLSILVKEIALVSGQHAIVVKDISDVTRELKECAKVTEGTEGVALRSYRLQQLQVLAHDLLARERQLLEHREALLAQLRS